MPTDHSLDALPAPVGCASCHRLWQDLYQLRAANAELDVELIHQRGVAAAWEKAYTQAAHELDFAATSHQGLQAEHDRLQAALERIAGLLPWVWNWKSDAHAVEIAREALGGKS